MANMMEMMKVAGSAQSARLGVNRWGHVTSVRQTDVGYEVKVSYPYGDGQGESIPTGWMPVLTPMVGPGWGLVTPPLQGAQVFVAPDHGDGSSGVVIGMAFSTEQMPPQTPVAIDGANKPVAQGEFALVSRTGAVMRFAADGSIYMKAPVVVEGTLTVKGDIVSTTGNITAKAGDVSDKHGSLDRLRGNYNAHVHGTSPTTSRPDPE